METLTSHPRDAELRALVDATARLRAISDEGLLRTFASLTHRLHASTGFDQEDAAYAQRDLVKAEILRRMGGRS